MPNISHFRTYIPTIIWSATILFFTYIMALIILPYTTWKWDVDFLLTKQMIVHLDYYRWSFYGHIFSSIFILGSGAFLFSKTIMRQWPNVHRFFGRTYVGLVLLVSAPTGLVMAFYANGGWPAKTSFILLAPLWWYMTWKGFRTAKNQQFGEHKKWMMRSYALSLSAVSLRIYQMILSAFFMIDPVVQYISVSWAAWTGNLIVVEMILAWPFLKNLFLENMRRQHVRSI